MADEDGAGAVMAFLSGAIVGAIAGLLLAPKSGRESLEDLRGYWEENRGRVRGLADRAGEAANEAIDRGREAAEHAAGRLHKTVSRGRSFVKDKLDMASEAARAGREAMRTEQDRLTSES
jgi:gas vesicle protein